DDRDAIAAPRAARREAAGHAGGRIVQLAVAPRARRLGIREVDQRDLRRVGARIGESAQVLERPHVSKAPERGRSARGRVAGVARGRNGGRGCAADAWRAPRGVDGGAMSASAITYGPARAPRSGSRRAAWPPRRGTPLARTARAAPPARRPRRPPRAGDRRPP